MSVPTRMWKPSELATPAKVRELLADTGLDAVTREALQHRLAAMEALARGVDPFRGVRQADYAAEEPF